MDVAQCPKGSERVNARSTMRFISRANDAAEGLVLDFNISSPAQAWGHLWVWQRGSACREETCCSEAEEGGEKMCKGRGGHCVGTDRLHVGCGLGVSLVGLSVGLV